jgi:hypothetical protein
MALVRWLTQEVTATWTVWIARGGKAWSGEECGLLRFWEVGGGKGFLRLDAMVKLEMERFLTGLCGGGGAGS